MAFVAYFEIENPRDKYVTFFREKGFTEPSRQWVAQEKIHGSNISFGTDNSGIVTGAKRNHHLGPDENFFGWQKLYKKYEADVKIIFNRVIQLLPEVEKLQVFGEIFGGNYPGLQTPPGNKCVQKGVFYSPTNDILIYDIRVTLPTPTPSVTEENTKKEDGNNDGEDSVVPENMVYLSYNDIVNVMDGLTLRYIKASHFGTFDELVVLNPIFETTIPAMYGLQPVAGNLSEGYVIKSNERHRIVAEERPIMKVKNEVNFGEVKNPTNQKDTQVDSGKVEEFLTDVLRYVTQNRFNAVISKIGPDCQNSQLNGLFLADVFKDYFKDLGTEKATVFKRVQKEVKIKLQEHISNARLIDTWKTEYLA